MAQPRDRDRHPVAWREAGDGDAVVFLHGIGGSRSAWEPQLQALSDRWRCVAWDMPGYGASAQPTGPLTFSSIASALVRLLDVLGVERAHVCGLSFGGQHALHTALEFPDRVASLVLADTSAAFGLDGTDAHRWRTERLAPLDAGAELDELAVGIVDRITAPGFAGSERDRAVSAFGRIGVEGFRSAVECLPNHDVRPRLAEITVPTLVIVGELDRETPVAYARQLADGITGARLEVVPGAGHLTPAEAPAAFNDLLRTFLTLFEGGQAG